MSEVGANRRESTMPRAADRPRKKTAAEKVALSMRDDFDEVFQTSTTTVKVTARCEVGVVDGEIHLWSGGRCVVISGLTPEQASLLSDDLLDVAAAG